MSRLIILASLFLSFSSFATTTLPESKCGNLKTNNSNSFNSTALAPIKIKLETSDTSSKGIGASELLAGLALAVSVAGLIFTVVQAKKQQSTSIKETFWMREVLIPHFLSGFLTFVKDAPACYRASDNLGDFYGSYALNEINDLKDAVKILNVGTKALGDAVSESFDEFENNMMKATDNEKFMALLTALTTDVITKIQNAQAKIS
ncbi:hypothetical protein [Aliivibrio fischeri]|uniref:hypothetical protein n=1 Tax=Aliivibrio fischeri TaxID=668 RepID=UPI00080E33AA|nr:hypothetical protein [Aliivibrio fischeri]OCH06556.1 hypothetical protein A6E11_17305 [Aliivibrio fischeri]